MANVAVVGAQWGDEGKGKVVDWLSERADIVVRFQGGHNAGHTLVIGDKTFKLSLLPSGVVRPGKLGVIGNGVVVDPWALCAEIDKLAAPGRRRQPRQPAYRRERHADPAAAPRARRHPRGGRRRRQDRHHRTRHRARLRGQGRPPRHPRCRTCATRRRSAPRSTASSCITTRCAAASASRSSPRTTLLAELTEIAPKVLPFVDVTWELLDTRAPRRQAHPVRGRAGRAARHRPRHLSVRHVVEHGRGAGGHRLGHGAARHRLRARHRQGVHDARRLRAVPDRARPTRSATASASAAASSAR